MSSPRSVLSKEADPERNVGLPNRVIAADAGSFRDKFNRSSFEFSHNLRDHPLFDLRRLSALGQSLWPRSMASFHSCDIPLNKGWSLAPSRVATIEDAIERIGESGSWVLLKGVQEDPDFLDLLNQCIRELEDLTEVPLRREITWMDAYVFIASPGSLTPYHMDHEANFLFQITGEKLMNVFDANDRSVLTDSEIERYYAGDFSAAKYRDENQTKASVYHLGPGMGLHHPVRAPHWVRNGDAPSITLSILFFLREYDLEARIYQVNSYLRRLGLTPVPPGRSRFRDSLKRSALGAISRRGKPRTKYEALRSGMTRLEAPIRFGMRLLRSKKRE